VLSSPDAIRAAWADAMARARAVPGVEASAMVDTVPMREGFNELTFVTAMPAPPPDQQPMALATSVMGDYLTVMGIPLRRGRFFDERDRAGSPPVIVIDEVMARQAFGEQEAVGKRLWIQVMGPDPLEVIGVVGHVRHWGPADDQARTRAQFYYPFAQVPDGLMRRWSQLTSIAVRTSIPPASVLEPLRRELRGVSGDQVLYEVRTLDDLASRTLGLQRFLVLLFGIFAGVALLLACLGVYGVLAHLSSQRVPEFVIRMALGANAGSVVRLVLRQSLVMVGAGVAMGTAAALAAGRVLRGLVDGVQPTDLSTLALVIAVLASAALVASYIPARRAGRLDAVAALKQD
jgi:putative ABC transport system permease protein